MTGETSSDIKSRLKAMPMLLLMLLARSCMILLYFNIFHIGRQHVAVAWPGPINFGLQWAAVSRIKQHLPQNWLCTRWPRPHLPCLEPTTKLSGFLAHGKHVEPPNTECCKESSDTYGTVCIRIPFCMQ